MLYDNVNDDDNEKHGVRESKFEGRKRPKMTRMLILNAEREEF